MKWEKVDFGELYLLPSKNGLNRPSNVRGSGYRMINMGELFANDRIKDIPMELVLLNDRELESSNILENDLLFARQSIVLSGAGKCSIVLEVPEITTFESHLIRIRLNQKRASPLFYYYYFRTPLANMTSLVQQGVQSGIRGSELKFLRVIYPPLHTQHRIASILSAYDDLIENNLKRIKLLEEKARIEYKSIQKNEKLEIEKAVEVLQFTTGKLNSNAAIQNGLYPFFTCGQEILRTNTFSVDEEVVLLGGNNASAIYPVFYYKGKFDAYQRTYIIKPKPAFYISFKYLYFFWEGKLDYLKNISTGAATKFLTLKILNDIDVPLPSKKVMEEYEILTEPIFELKAILAEQNTKLREARDILLPKLMNGQIEV